MSEKDVVIKLEGVSKKYKLFGNKLDRMKEALHPMKKKYHKEFYALNDINLTVHKGEILGIVGMNGAGKSTMLTIIAGISQPSSGSVKVTGSVVPLLELGSGFNPEFTGLENIYFYNSILGYSKKDTDAIVDKILDFADIGEFIHQPIKTYSSGMKARLSFAVSVNIDPDILIVDEVLSVGDELFRRKSFAKIEEFFLAQKTILFVSHSIQSVNQLCSRAIMLYNGRIVLDGPAKFVTMNYQKFIFSRPEQKASLLNDFKYLRPEENDAKENKVPSEKIVAQKNQNQIQIKTSASRPRETAYMVKNYIPKSTVITRLSNIDVSQLKIFTANGAEVNHIVAGEDYVISYELAFMEDVGVINLGIGINTEMGVPVTWRFFPDCATFMDRPYMSGDNLKVMWRFRCLLIPDTYFIGITIRRSNNGENEIAFKGSDIAVFRVIGDKNIDRGGYFDADFSLELQ